MDILRTLKKWAEDDTSAQVLFLNGIERTGRPRSHIPFVSFWKKPISLAQAISSRRPSPSQLSRECVPRTEVSFQSRLYPRKLEISSRRCCRSSVSSNAADDGLSTSFSRSTSTTWSNAMKANTNHQSLHSLRNPCMIMAWRMYSKDHLVKFSNTPMKNSEFVTGSIWNQCVKIVSNMFVDWKYDE